MARPDDSRPDRRVLLSFRRIDRVLLVTVSMCLVFVLLFGVLAVVNGVRAHDPAEWGTGIVVMAAFALVAASLLWWQLRLGELTTATVTVLNGRMHRRGVPLTQIDEVGMVYAIPKEPAVSMPGWLPYVWLRDGTALRLPLAKLRKNPPERGTWVCDWQPIADTPQGRVCVAISGAVDRAGRPPPRHPSRAVWHAGKHQEVSFWSTDPTVGVLSMFDQPAPIRRAASGSSVQVAPSGGRRPVTRGARWLQVTTLGLMGLEIAGVLGLIMTPTKDSPGWLLPATFVVTGAFTACAIAVRVQRLRGGRSGPE